MIALQQHPGCLLRFPGVLGGRSCGRLIRHSTCQDLEKLTCSLPQLVSSDLMVPLLQSSWLNLGQIWCAVNFIVVCRHAQSFNTPNPLQVHAFLQGLRRGASAMHGPASLPLLALTAHNGPLGAVPSAQPA